MEVNGIANASEVPLKMAAPGRLQLPVDFLPAWMNFRHGPLQPHPGVTRIGVRAGTENLCIIGSARTYHLLELPGGGRNVNIFIN